MLFVNSRRISPIPPRDAQIDQMTSFENWFGRFVLDTQLAHPVGEPIDPGTVELSGASEAVGLRHTAEQFEVDFLCKPSERSIADRRHRLEERQRLQVMSAMPSTWWRGRTRRGFHVSRSSTRFAVAPPLLVTIDRIRPSMNSVVGGWPRPYIARQHTVTAVVVQSSILVRAWPRPSVCEPTRHRRDASVPADIRPALDSSKELFKYTKLNSSARRWMGADQSISFLDFAQIARPPIARRLSGTIPSLRPRRELEPRGKLLARRPQAVSGTLRVDAFSNPPDVPAHEKVEYSSVSGSSAGVDCEITTPRRSLSEVRSRARNALCPRRSPRFGRARIRRRRDLERDLSPTVFTWPISSGEPSGARRAAEDFDVDALWVDRAAGPAPTADDERATAGRPKTLAISRAVSDT